MRAASEKPATGDLPLPSQQGRIVPNHVEFEQKNMSLGAGAAPVAKDSPAPSPSPIPPTTGPAEKEVKAKPATDVAAKETEGGKKPATLPTKAKPSEDDIALQTIPSAAPKPKFQNRSAQQLALLTPATAKPAPSEDAATQAQAEKLRVEGSISNRGRNAVNAKGTPLGRYYETVGRTISSRWNFYVKDKGDLLAFGSVRTVFTIDRKGHVVRIHSEENTSNDAFATVCERAVLESQIPPPGRDLSDALADGKLDITFTFTLY
jgi:hypothetical protein